MPLVANGVARFTLNGRYGATNTWANIWDAWLGGVPDNDRPLACLEYAQKIIDAWDQTIGGPLSQEVVLDSVSWVDLDTIDGSTGVATEGWNQPPPYRGGSTAAPSPANVSILATKVTTSARGSKSGRMYIPGVVEADTDGNNLTSGAATVVNTQLGLFLDDLTENLEPAFEGVWPVVVHTRNTGTPENPNIVVTGSSQITSLTTTPLLATQRRRLRR